MAQNNNNIKLELNDNAMETIQIETKVPTKILHFSDGVLEYYSDEDEENHNLTDKKKVDNVDPSKLSWGPWLTHKAMSTGQTVVHACDYAGETLAYYLGITTPKYQFEIEEYERMQRRQKEEAEMAKGWVCNHETDTMTEQPHQPSNEAVFV